MIKNYDTDSFSWSKFRLHGRIEWSALEEGVILYRAQGPFNSELFDALIELESEGFLEFMERWGNWVEVVIFDHSSLAMSDALARYGQFIQKSVKQRAFPIASAFVFPEGIEGASISKEAFRKLYESGNIPFKTFTSAEPAITWAKSYLEK